MTRIQATLKSIVAVLLALTASNCYLVPGTPEAAFHEFQTTQTKEAFLVLPLCKAGEGVVPLVTEKVRGKTLERRLYAIAFLGTSSGVLPVPVLESIVRDESEDPTIRYAALESLFSIDEQKGRAAAEAMKAGPDVLGRTARRLISITDHSKFRREYYQETCSGRD